ncbi:hypothetical protein HPB47_003348 [Ixodes persulcatus]|uniref:Uncharacterized protein n=1 Tax=Ixodes persulcatus TaxID=34615 RepID=A0AC60PKB9_IXOPE|nr:hypothetical protein HPB47_003348 [Ixodes persulcatus]
MAAPLEPLSAQAGRKRFTIVEDILVLREVLAMNLFVNSSRWDTVAVNLNEALGRNFSVRGVRDRCDLLLATRQKRYREHLGSLEKRAEEDRRIKKLEIALEKRRLAMEERQIERRLAIEERQVTLSEDRLSFEKEKFYVLQEAAAEERRHRLQLQEHYVQ